MLRTRLGAKDDPHPEQWEGPTADFLRANQDGDPDILAAVEALPYGGRYHGGGGAAPPFVVERVTAPLRTWLAILKLPDWPVGMSRRQVYEQRRPLYQGVVARLRAAAFDVIDAGTSFDQPRRPPPPPPDPRQVVVCFLVAVGTLVCRSPDRELPDFLREDPEVDSVIDGDEEGFLLDAEAELPDWVHAACPDCAHTGPHLTNDRQPHERDYAVKCSGEGCTHEWAADAG